MGIAKSTYSWGTVLILLLTALAPTLTHARQIQFSNQVPMPQIRALVADISTDLTMVENERVKSVMGLANLSDRSLKQWLTDRVGYVVGEDENDSERLVKIQNYTYQNPGIFPTFEEPDPNIPDPNRELGKNGKHRVAVVMANVGTSYYYRGKDQNALVGYKFVSARGRQIVAMTSPRVGIIKIGEGLFGIMPNRDNPASIVNKWFRLETFFHEAHHSDGNGKSLGFPHAVCPKGHKYFNYNACDREGNGPYAVGALLLKQARLTCMRNKTCSAEEAQMLANAATDSFSRILSRQAIDPRPEGVVGGANSGS